MVGGTLFGGLRVGGGAGSYLGGVFGGHIFFFHPPAGGGFPLRSERVGAGGAAGVWFFWAEDGGCFFNVLFFGGKGKKKKREPHARAPNPPVGGGKGRGWGFVGRGGGGLGFTISKKRLVNAEKV